jgi:tryptophan halogenase
LTADGDPELTEVVILGGGSAGLIAALALQSGRPSLRLTLVRSTQMGVITVGESTTPLVPLTLHLLLGVDPGEFHRHVAPTYKLGIRFLWGPRPRFHFTFTPQFQGQVPGLSRPNAFYCEPDCDYADLTSALMERDLSFERSAAGRPRLGVHHAYHLENKRLVAYLERIAAARGVRLLDRTVRDVRRGEHGVESLELDDGSSLRAGLFVDCSGFRSRLLGEALGEPYISYRSSLFCDRAVVGDWPRESDPIKPYTTAETMPSGWAWQIEHREKVNRGYVFSSDFVSRGAAEDELRRANPRLGDLRPIEFRSGRFERAWVGNVVALGNAAGFVEPLESTALGVLCDGAIRLKTALTSGAWRQPSESVCRAYNAHHAFMWDSIRRFLVLHYKLNTRLDSAFWRACRADAVLGDASELLDYYRENGPALPWPLQRQACEPFGVDGYLALLVGQAVPYARRAAPSAEELSRWQEHKRRLWLRAGSALSMEAGFEHLDRDSYEWRPYGDSEPAAPDVG